MVVQSTFFHCAQDCCCCSVWPNFQPRYQIQDANDHTTFDQGTEHGLRAAAEIGDSIRESAPPKAVGNVCSARQSEALGNGPSSLSGHQLPPSCWFRSPSHFSSTAMLDIPFHVNRVPRRGVLNLILSHLLSRITRESPVIFSRIRYSHGLCRTQAYDEGT